MRRLKLTFAVLGTFAINVATLANAQSPVIVTLPSNDMGYNHSTDTIFAAVPAGMGGPLANSLVPITPTSGALGTATFIGNDPQILAISDNGQFVHVGLGGAPMVRRYDVARGGVDLEFPLGNALNDRYANDIEAVPGQPESIAASLRHNGVAPRFEGVAMYRSGERLSHVLGGRTGSTRIEFGGGNVMYGFNNETDAFAFQTIDVAHNGLRTLQSTRALFRGIGVDIDYGNGRIVTTAGDVIDPVGHMIIGSLGASGPVAVIGDIAVFGGNGRLDVYHAGRLQYLGSVELPGLSGEIRGVIHAGGNRIAARTSSHIAIVASHFLPEPAGASLTFGLVLTCWLMRRAAKSDSAGLPAVPDSSRKVAKYRRGPTSWGRRR